MEAQSEPSHPLDLPPEEWIAPPDPEPGIAPLMHISSPEPSWLATQEFPQLVTRSRLARLVRKLPRARRGWILDSDAYQHLQRNGTWTIPAEQYAAEADRWMRRIGRLKAAAVQDWPTEDEVLAATKARVISLWGPARFLPDYVRAHQEWTIESYLRLRSLAPYVPWMPVLQGRTPGEYLRHRQMWAEVGVDLTKHSLVGMGSLCKRSGSMLSFFQMALAIEELAHDGLRLHGFGLKTTALEHEEARKNLVSVDSGACFYAARRQRLRSHRDCPHPGDCRNCPRWAADWISDLADRGLVAAA